MVIYFQLKEDVKEFRNLDQLSKKKRNKNKPNMLSAARHSYTTVQGRTKKDFTLLKQWAFQTREKGSAMLYSIPNPHCSTAEFKYYSEPLGDKWKFHCTFLLME